MPSSHLILCRPLLLLPSIFPSISVFSNESVLRIRWPKYWFQLQHHKLAKHTLFINSLFKVCSLSFFLFLFSLIFNFIFKLYNIVLVLPNIEMNPPQVYMCSPSWTLLPPHTIPLGRPSAPAPSIQYRASNLDWWLIPYMILYVFQCHSPKSSHPLPLPQSPKDCSIYQCLFWCLVYRVLLPSF